MPRVYTIRYPFSNDSCILYRLHSYHTQTKGVSYTFYNVDTLVVVLLLLNATVVFVLYLNSLIVILQSIWY